MTFKTSKDCLKEESKFIVYNLLHNVPVPIKIEIFINLKFEFTKVNEKPSKSNFNKETKFLDIEKI